MAGYDYVNGRTLGELPDAGEPTFGDDGMAYANRVGLAVHSSSYSCEPGDFSLTPIERVLSAALAQSGLIDAKLIWSEGLLEKRTLICGFCGRRPVIASEMLRKYGIDSWAFDVSGQVLVKFAAGGYEYLVDPDYMGFRPTDTTCSRHLAGEIVTKYTKTDCRTPVKSTTTYKPIRQ